jgi:hypothetical protein
MPLLTTADDFLNGIVFGAIVGALVGGIVYLFFFR